MKYIPFRMIFEIPKEAIIRGLVHQLSSFFSISDSEIEIINSLDGTVFNSCEFSFIENMNKYYSKNGEGYFIPYHSGQ